MGTFIGATASSSNTGQPALTWSSLGSYAAGDVAVLFVYHSNTTTVTTPTGWTKIGTGIPAAGSNYCEIYTKTLAGTETGTTTIATTSAGKVNQCCAVKRGVNQPTSSEVASVGYQTDTTQSRGVPALSHSGNLDWITSCATRNSTPPTSFTAPAGTTMGASTFTTSSGANCAAVAYANASESDGSVGSGNWQHNTAVAVDWTIVTVALVNAVTRITKTTSTSWDTRARAAKSTATTWDTKARASKSTSTTWSTRARVVKSTSTSWDVAGSLTRIAKTLSTTWSTLSRVAKSTSTSWDVAGSLTRITKSTSTIWNTRSRVAKSTATTWSTRARLAKSTSTSWNITSMISEASWPAYIGHRGTDPGPEETMFAYDTLYARSPNYWHEGDAQTLNDGVTQVGSHDDTIDRMYSSGPVSTGNISSMSPAQWDATFLRYNTGFTGTEKQAMRLSAWVAKYGKATATPAIGLWENKVGTDIADTIATFAGCRGTVILNCNTLADAQAAVAAGFDACYQTDTPTFSQFTANGIKYLSINYTAMTGTIATQAIAAGVKVLMYTVNSTTNRDSMLALFSNTSYAGFISNKPQTLAGTTRITKATSTTWVTRARVAKTTSTSWNVAGSLTRITKNTSTTWSTRARIAKSIATSWGTRSRLAKSTGTTWVTRQRVVKTTSSTWNVATTVSPTSRAKVWNGTSWVAKPVKVWNGTSWVTKTLKVRSASSTWI